MKFALVTTCRNEIKSINNWKRDVLIQTRQPDEIVVVDSLSTDGTLEALEEWAKKDARVKVIKQKSKVAEGRNWAIKSSTCDNIISTDLGCRLDPKWFEQLCIPLENDSEIMVVAGNYRADMETVKTPSAWADYYLSNCYIPSLKQGFLPSSRSIAYRKKLWEELQGYPEDLSYAGDDTVFALQILKHRYKMAFAEKAICYWSRHTFLKNFWKESYVYAFGNGEAAICPPKFSDLMDKSYFLLLYHAVSFISAIKRSFIPALKALRNGKIGSAFLIPILLYGKNIENYKGYKNGFRAGLTNCVSCRMRLKSVE